MKFPAHITSATFIGLFLAAPMSLHSMANTNIATIHVAVGGNDSHPGTAQQPVASIAQAAAMVDKAGGPGEIVVHGGVYYASQSVNAPTVTNAPSAAPLVIRAVDGEKVVFDGSIPLTNAQPLQGHAGVYVVQGNFGRRPPLIWEEESRIRYLAVADLAAVQAFPGTCTILDDKTVAFHTTDGQLPVAKNARMSAQGVGLGISRDNVTARGFHFHNHVLNRWSAAVWVGAKNVTVDSCEIFNAFRGVLVSEQAQDARIVNCRMSDVGGGIFTNGKDTHVERCWITKTRDSFMIDTYSQDDSGIQYYAPAAGGTCRFNFVRGFSHGIFVKAGPGRRYVMEHNTLIAGEGTEGTAMYNHDWPRTSNSVFRANILVGFSSLLWDAKDMTPGDTFDENVCWSPGFEKETSNVVATAMTKGTGAHNVIADPMFVAPGKDDYRLLVGSKAVALAGKDGPAGAFPAAPKNLKIKLPPSVEVEPQAPAKLAGPTGKLFVRRDDEMNRGFQFVSNLGPPSETNGWLTASRDVKFSLKTHDPAFKIVKVGVRVNRGKEIVSKFQPELSVHLPDTDGLHEVKVRVLNSDKTWSKPATIPVVLARQAPRLVGAPKVVSNQNGVIVIFHTDRPTLAQIEFAAADGKWIAVTNQTQSQYKYDGNAAATNLQEWVVPAQVHTRTLLAPLVKPNTEYQYRLTLSDELDNKAVAGAWNFKTVGAPRGIHVSATGEDAEDRGTPDKPLRTLQFAVDRALPGDTIRLAPGLYPEPTVLSHGGIEGKPITIEAEEPNTVFLDGRKRPAAMVRLAGASHVTIRNLTFRWFRETGLTVEDCQHVTVSGCTFINHFWAEWPTAHGIDACPSRYLTVDHCIFARLEYGIWMRDCPYTTIVNNTAVGNLFASLWLIASSQGSVIRNNAFCFTGNNSMRIYEPSAEAFRSLDLDYNNYAAQIRDAEEERPDAEVKVPFDYLTPSKQMLERTDDQHASKKYEEKVFCSLKRWRAAMGKDAHSIFADPKFVDPASGRFDVHKDSPNLGAGKDGADIGALGYLGEK